MKVFRTRKKRARKWVCNNCKYYLWKHGGSIEGYIKMEKTLKEEMVWDSPDKGVMTVTHQKPVIIDGKEVGSEESTYKLNCTWEDVLAGKETLLLTQKQTQKKVDKVQADIDLLGKIPVKTAEMVRLAKLMQAIGKIERNDALKNDLAPLNAKLLEIKFNIKEREEIISSRPTNGGGK